MTEKEKTIVKTMSITEQEYRRSLIRLYPQLADNPDFSFVQLELTADNSWNPENSSEVKPVRSIDLHFVPLEAQKFGGLLKLPQAQITIKFHGLSDEETTKFVYRFDRVFQRGGG